MTDNLSYSNSPFFKYKGIPPNINFDVSTVVDHVLFIWWIINSLILLWRLHFFLANTDDIGEIDSNAIAAHDTTNGGLSEDSINNTKCMYQYM